MKTKNERKISLRSLRKITRLSILSIIALAILKNYQSLINFSWQRENENKGVKKNVVGLSYEKIALVNIPELGYNMTRKQKRLIWKALNISLSKYQPNIELDIYESESYNTMKPNIEKYRKFIIIAQDPFDRVMNQLNYDKKKRTPKYSNLLSYFGSVENISVHGLALNSNSLLPKGRERDCALVARKYFDKRIKEKRQHFYTKEILENQEKDIYMIRLDRSAYDKASITKLLTGEVDEEPEITFPPHEDSIFLSEKGRKNICYYLCTEIQAYKELILRANNINSIEKQLSLTKLKESCGDVFNQQSCHNDEQEYFKILNVTSYQNKLRQNNPTLDYSLRHRSIAFIHIGKTGGTTASRMIRRKCMQLDGCWSFVALNEIRNIPRNETQISLQVQDYYHVRKPAVRKFSTYIVTVRNPIWRIISWYIHAHPENKIMKMGGKLKRFFGCYSEIDDVATYGLAFRSTSHKTICQEYASFWLRRNLRFESSTKRILKPSREKEIFVIRAEFFWYDWDTINRMLGETNVTAREESITHKECTNEVVTNRTISSEGLSNLCHHLCSEIKIYLSLISRAKNLNTKDKRWSFNDILKTCPKEVRSKGCKKPILKKRKKKRRKNNSKKIRVTNKKKWRKKKK